MIGITLIAIGAISLYAPTLTRPAIAGLFPTNPFYNPSYGYSQFHYKYQGTSGVGQVNIICPGNGNTAQQLIGCGLYTASQGTFYVPVGLSANRINYNDCVGVTCGVSFADWSYKLPGDIPDACFSSGSCYDTNSFSLTGTVTGANGGILLTSSAPAGDPTCTNYNGKAPDPGSGGACWSADYAVVQSAQSQNPPCTTGVTECLIYTQPTAKVNQTTITGPPPPGLQCPGGSATCTYSKAVNQTVTKTWYIYREITSLQLQLTAPLVTPVCTKTNTGVANVCTQQNSNVCGFFTLSKCDPMPTLTGALPGWVSEMNTVSTLSSTRISFGVNVNGFAGLPCTNQDVNSGNCWWGIIGVWIGGQGFQTSGCVAPACSGNSFVQSQHTQLAIYQDAALTQPAAVPPVDDLIHLSTITNQTLLSLIQANTYSQVFTYIDTANNGLGATYSATTATCSLQTLSNCVKQPVPIVVNVPLVYDIIGSKQLSTWLTYYPGLPPSGGSNSGGITGRVTDTGGTPIAGACVSLNGVCSSIGGIQSTTGLDGSYSLTNVPIGTYSVYATANGYGIPYPQTGIKVSIGGSTTVNFVLQVLPGNNGQWCLIPSLPNPINPFGPPSPPFLCIPPIPGWVLPSILVLVGLGLVAVISFSPLGQGAGFLALSRVRRGK